MKVLVTGGAGLIGMAARAALQARGHWVVAIYITDFGRNDHESYHHRVLMIVLVCKL